MLPGQSLPEHQCRYAEMETPAMFSVVTLRVYLSESQQDIVIELMRSKVTTQMFRRRPTTDSLSKNNYCSGDVLLT